LLPARLVVLVPEAGAVVPEAGALVPEAGALVPAAGAALEFTPEQPHMAISTTSPMDSKNNLRFIKVKMISPDHWFSGN
jgi:hypothetical protein